MNKQEEEEDTILHANQTAANEYRYDKIIELANDTFKRIRDKGYTVVTFDVINAVMVGIYVWGYDLNEDTYEITQLIVQLLDEQGITPTRIR